MKRRIVSDEKLITAAALVREAMLEDLQKPLGEEGVFSSEFEGKIEKLKYKQRRTEQYRQWIKGAAAAAVWVVVVFAVVLVSRTEVRAAVTAWFKETVATYTAYWFDGEEQETLTEYELTWIPEGYEIITDEITTDYRILLYQKDTNEYDGFTLLISKPQSDTPVMVDVLKSAYVIEEVWINGYLGELYISQDPKESHALIWGDHDQTLFALTAFLPIEDILHIAECVKMENSPN